MGDVHEKNSTTGEWGVRSSTQTTASSGSPAENVTAETVIYDSAGNAIFPDSWGITVDASTADGPTQLSTTDGTDTWTQTITYDANGWPSTASWVKT